MDNSSAPVANSNDRLNQLIEAAKLISADSRNYQNPNDYILSIFYDRSILDKNGDVLPTGFCHKPVSAVAFSAQDDLCEKIRAENFGVPLGGQKRSTFNYFI